MTEKVYFSDLDIIAKAAPTERQIKNRKCFGAKKFEIQLLNNDVRISELFNILKDIDTVSVHTPIVYHDDDSWDELSLSDLYEKNMISVLKKTCNLANKLAKKYGHDVLVIIHCDISMYEIKKYRLQILCKNIKHILKRYKNVFLVLENISPLRIKPFRFNNGCLFGPSEIAEYLVQNGVKKVGTALDFCHMEMTQFLLDSYKESDVYKSFPQYDFETYMCKYRKLLKIVHFNEAIEDGYGYKHGQIASKEFIEKFVKYYLNRNEEFPYICMEVKENNYNMCTNYVKAVNVFAQVIDEINIQK